MNTSIANEYEDENAQSPMKIQAEYWEGRWCNEIYQVV
jgi:hypothetical protein